MAIRRGLRFIPIAVLTAIAAPAIVDVHGNGDYEAAPARALAAAAALLAAWRIGNLPVSLVTGLGALLLLQLLGVAVG